MLVLLATQLPASANETVDIQTIRAERDSGAYDDAFEHLIRLAQDAKQDLSLDLVLLARKARGELQDTQITQLFRAAVESSLKTPTELANLDVRLLVRLAAADHFASTNQHALVARPVIVALEDLNRLDAPPSKRSAAVIRFGLQTAAADLVAGRQRSAEKLYRAIVQATRNEDNKNAHAKATLGLGWVLSSQTESFAEAAQFLGTFVRDQPDHDDAPRALAQAIRCLRGSGEHELAAKATRQFLTRWPKHKAAAEVILLSLNHNSSGLDHFIEWMEKVAPDEWPPALLPEVVSESLGSKLFTGAAHRLAVSDTTGQFTTETLDRLSETEQFATAESLAAAILSLDSEIETHQPMACESVCRWAGRTERWSMLALHAETAKPSRDDRRTPHVERLFAEALTREGDTAAALKWWQHVVDQRGATDFATRLRLAECCVSEASITDAKTRIEEARRVARISGARALLDFLDADLAIRKLEFDDARRRYEAIIREASVTAELRGRAQWMIGETYLMQERFSEAIDAYRRVEGLAPDGRFVPASLLQAGKAFEQLGRTREAAVCYGALVSRFADSHHASLARRRLTELPVDQDKQSIRR